MKVFNEVIVKKRDLAVKKKKQGRAQKKYEFPDPN